MKKILIRGFLAISPIAISLILIVWIYNHLEYFFGAPIEFFYPEIYFPGIGIIVALIVLFILGLLLNHWIFNQLYLWLEGLFKRTPLLKTIYISVTDLMSFFNADSKKTKKVAMVKFQGMKVLGLVTRESFGDLPKGIGNEESMAVFFPFSYQIGGLTAIVPKKDVEIIDMSIEQALRFMSTAGSPSNEKTS